MIIFSFFSDAKFIVIMMTKLVIDLITITIVPLPFDLCKSSWWMQLGWSSVVMGSWLGPWVVYTFEVNWIYVIVLVSLIMLMADLWDYDVAYGSLRFVLVVTKIDVVSWYCSFYYLEMCAEISLCTIIVIHWTRFL